MIQKKTPRCSRVVLVEPTRTIYGHTIFKFTGKDGGLSSGFIEREKRDDGSVVWRPVYPLIDAVRVLECRTDEAVR